MCSGVEVLRKEFGELRIRVRSRFFVRKREDECGRRKKGKAVMLLLVVVGVCAVGLVRSCQLGVWVKGWQEFFSLGMARGSVGPEIVRKLHPNRARCWKSFKVKCLSRQVPPRRRGNTVSLSSLAQRWRTHADPGEGDSFGPSQGGRATGKSHLLVYSGLSTA